MFSCKLFLSDVLRIPENSSDADQCVVLYFDAVAVLGSIFLILLLLLLLLLSARCELCAETALALISLVSTVCFAILSLNVTPSVFLYAGRKTLIL